MIWTAIIVGAIVTIIKVALDSRKSDDSTRSDMNEIHEDTMLRLKREGKAGDAERYREILTQLRQNGEKPFPAEIIKIIEKRKQ